jgi:molecular chaperone DnaJ
MKNYYNILGVSKDATPEEIKKSYRKLSLEYHPDKNKTGEEKFKEIAEAYSIVGDTTKRKQYDNGGLDMGNGFSGRGEDPFDIFEQFFGKAHFHRTPRQRKGGDLKVRISVTLEECYFRKEKHIRINRGVTNNKMCPICNGRGVTEKVVGNGFFRQLMNMVCNGCGGNGFLNGGEQKKEEIKFQIPQGIDDGHMMRMRGKGNGIWGGIDGDLLITLQVMPDGTFQRRGSDLLYEIKMNFVNIVLGKEITIPHFDGPLKTSTPSNHDFHKPIRLKEKGFYSERGLRGDMYIFIVPTIPSMINKKEESLLQELIKYDNFKE